MSSIDDEFELLNLEVIKEIFDIIVPNNRMTDDEIKKVVRAIGEGSPDTIKVGDRLILQKLGWDAMLFVTMTYFLDYYVRHHLSPPPN